MKLQDVCLIFTMALLSADVLATVEIYQIKEVLKHIDPSKRTLILLDIDNTLLCPQNDLGADYWLEYMVNQKMAAGMDRGTALRQLLPLVFHLNLNIDFIAIEETVAADVACIQRLCDRVFCLTARSPIIVDKTLVHLSNYSLVFGIPELQEHTFNFAKPSIYKSGILSCGWNDKGHVLIAFLDLINYIPEVIIFVDDKQHNLDSVRKALQGRNIEYIGLRYAGVDHRSAYMDPVKVEAALQEFLMKYPLCPEDYEGHF